MGYLFWFCLPLMLTFLMMAGAAPVVTIGIARMHDAIGEKVHLSAFVFCFVISLFLYSPMFYARNIAIRTVNDRRSLWRFTIFFCSCSAFSSLAILLVSQVDVVGHFVFGTMLDKEPQVEHLARNGMLLFVPIPPMIALRGLGHACHINNGQTWYVGIGTGIRLGVMALYVFGYAVHHDISGPVLGGMTYLLGVTAETIFVLGLLWNKPQWRHISEEKQLTYWQYFCYAGPLMMASFMTKFADPVLLYLLTLGIKPELNGATYNIVRDTGWLMLSAMHSVQPAMVTFATSRGNLGVLIKFALVLLSIVTLVAVAVALTPLRDLIFVDLVKVDNETILQLLSMSLIFLIPMPAAGILNLGISALHTRSGRTIWVTAGNIVGLVILLLAARYVDFTSFNGVYVAVLGGIFFHSISAVVQAGGLLRGGLAQAISDRSLTEHLDRRPPDIDHAEPFEDEAVPVVERVNV